MRFLFIHRANLNDRIQLQNLIILQRRILHNRVALNVRAFAMVVALVVMNAGTLVKGAVLILVPPRVSVTAVLVYVRKSTR